MNRNTRSRKNKARKATRTGDAKVISQSTKRNMQQVVYHNVDAKGCKSSITRHEPISDKRFVKPANHKYLGTAYRQPVQTSSRPTAE